MAENTGFIKNNSVYEVLLMNSVYATERYLMLLKVMPNNHKEIMHAAKDVMFHSQKVFLSAMYWENMKNPIVGGKQ
jgi:hypothetical protein